MKKKLNVNNVFDANEVENVVNSNMDTDLVIRKKRKQRKGDQSTKDDGPSKNDLLMQMMNKMKEKEAPQDDDKKETKEGNIKEVDDVKCKTEVKEEGEAIEKQKVKENEGEVNEIETGDKIGINTGEEESSHKEDIKEEKRNYENVEDVYKFEHASKDKEMNIKDGDVDIVKQFVNVIFEVNKENEDNLIKEKTEENKGKVENNNNRDAVNGEQDDKSFELDIIENKVDKESKEGEDKKGNKIKIQFNPEDVDKLKIISNIQYDKNIQKRFSEEYNMDNLELFDDKNFSIKENILYDVDNEKGNIDQILSEKYKDKPIILKRRIKIELYDEDRGTKKEKGYIHLKKFKNYESYKKYMIDNKNEKFIEIENLRKEDKEKVSNIRKLLDDKEILGEIIYTNVNEYIPYQFREFTNLITGIILESDEDEIKKYLMSDKKTDYIKDVLQMLLGEIYGVKGGNYEEIMKNIEKKDKIRMRFFNRYRQRNKNYNSEDIKDNLSDDDDDLDDDEFDLDSNILELELPVMYTYENGIRYTFFGGKLKDYGIVTYDEGRNIVNNLLLHGFVPEKYEELLFSYLNDEELKYDFDNFIEKYPKMFINYALSPSTIQQIKEVGYFDPSMMNKNEIAVNMGQLDSINLTQDDMKKYLDEIEGFGDALDNLTGEQIKQLFYIQASFTELKEIPIYRGNDWIRSAYNEQVERVLALRTEIQNQRNEIIKNPIKFQNRSNGNFKVVLNKTKIVDNNGKIREFSNIELAKRIKNTFSAEPMDVVAVNLLRTTSPFDLNHLEYLFHDFYYGGGTPYMMIERYEDSLKIFNKSNTEKVKNYRRSTYEQNFETFLSDYNYDITFLDQEMPKKAIYYQVYKLHNVNGYEENMVYINPKTKGNFTSLEKRDKTGLKDIQVALDNFHNYFNGGKELFVNGFKNIAAKTKVEIHNFDKNPRFFNPTILSAYIPFQFVLNIAFSKIKNYMKGMKHNLLGISDSKTTFSHIMHDLWYGDKIRMHYSDNFWIKENNYIFSVDVKRCDSNLSAICFEKPLLYFGERVLIPEHFKIFKEIVKDFIESIPHNTYLGIRSGKQYVLLESLFYWLPSGVVGTAYFNHLFTGMFLYISRDVGWISEDGQLSKNIKIMAEQFGIQLQVASRVFTGNPPIDYEIYEFDLLGRYGMYIKGTFVPLLEPKRMWLSLLYMKQTTIDKGAFIAILNRMIKAEEVLNHGGCLIPEIYQYCFTILLTSMIYLRKTILHMSDQLKNKLFTELNDSNISLISFMKMLYNVPMLDCGTYIYSKTHKLLKPPTEIINMQEHIVKRKDELVEFKVLLGQLVDDSKEYIKKKLNIEKFDLRDTKVGPTLLQEVLNVKNSELHGTCCIDEFIREIFQITSENTSRVDKDDYNSKNNPHFNYYARKIEPFLGENKEEVLTAIIREVWRNRKEKILENNKNLRYYILENYKQAVNKRIMEKKINSKKGKQFLDGFQKLIDDLNSMELNVIKNHLKNGKFIYMIVCLKSKSLTIALNNLNWSKVYNILYFNNNGLYKSSNNYKTILNTICAASYFRYYYGIGLARLQEIIKNNGKFKYKLNDDRLKLEIPKNFSNLLVPYSRYYRREVKKNGLPSVEFCSYDWVYNWVKESKNKNKINDFFKQKIVKE